MKGTLQEMCVVACAIGDPERPGALVLATKDEHVELTVEDDVYVIHSSCTDDGDAYLKGMKCDTLDETVEHLKVLGLNDDTEWALFDI